MNIVRFFFGHGWWVLWHIGFYLILLFSVVLTFFIFAQDLKLPGQKPDPASPASIMVLMIALGLGLVTLVDGLLLSMTLPISTWMRIGSAVLVAAAVTGAMFPLNIQLATQQSQPLFWLNAVLSAAIIAANLTMLWFAQTRAA